MTVPRICRLCRDLSRSWNQDLVDRYIGVVALVSSLVFRDVLRSLLATVAAMFVILAGPDLLRALLQWIVYGDRFYTMDWATLPRWYRAFDHLRLYDYWIGMQTFSGEAIFARSVVVCTITAAATLLLALWLFRRKAY